MKPGLSTAYLPTKDTKIGWSALFIDRAMRQAVLQGKAKLVYFGRGSALVRCDALDGFLLPEEHSQSPRKW